MAFDLLDGIFIGIGFLLAGIVKGVIGMGLPTVSLALLAIHFDLPTAMALLLIPSFATNLWQALDGGELRVLLRRLWPMLVTAMLFIGLGGRALTRLELSWLTGLLGLLLMLYAAAGLAGIRLRLQPRHEAWVGPLAGATNGVLTGMTGSFVVPGVLYLQALGLSRDQLVQAMGMLFTLSTLALGLMLGWANLLYAQQLGWSLAALAPAVLGMLAGRGLRRRLSELLFRRILLGVLLALGGYILMTAPGTGSAS